MGKILNFKWRHTKNWTDMQKVVLYLEYKRKRKKVCCNWWHLQFSATEQNKKGVCFVKIFHWQCGHEVFLKEIINKLDKISSTDQIID